MDIWDTSMQSPKGFGYKYSSRGQGTWAIKNLNWKKPGPHTPRRDEGRGPNK